MKSTALTLMLILLLSTSVFPQTTTNKNQAKSTKQDQTRGCLVAIDSNKIVCGDSLCKVTFEDLTRHVLKDQIAKFSTLMNSDDDATTTYGGSVKSPTISTQFNFRRAIREELTIEKSEFESLKSFEKRISDLAAEFKDIVVEIQAEKNIVFDAETDSLVYNVNSSGLAMVTRPKDYSLEGQLISSLGDTLIRFPKNVFVNKPYDKRDYITTEDIIKMNANQAASHLKYSNERSVWDEKYKQPALILRTTPEKAKELKGNIGVLVLYRPEYVGGKETIFKNRTIASPITLKYQQTSYTNTGQQLSGTVTNPDGTRSTIELSSPSMAITSGSDGIIINGQPSAVIFFNKINGNILSVYCGKKEKEPLKFDWPNIF